MAVLEGVNHAQQVKRLVGGATVGDTTRTRIRATRYSPLFSELILRMAIGNLTGKTNLENDCDVILDLYGVQYRNLSEIIEKTA